LLADISKLRRELAPYLAKGVLGDANSARFGDAFKPCCDVDPIAKDVVALDENIA